MGTIESEAALVVLTERLTRYGLIFRVPDHTMESVVKVLNRLERRLGKDFRRIFRSITVDNGSESRTAPEWNDPSETRGHVPRYTTATPAHRGSGAAMRI